MKVKIKDLSSPDIVKKLAKVNGVPEKKMHRLIKSRQNHMYHSMLHCISQIATTVRFHHFQLFHEGIMPTYWYEKQKKTNKKIDNKQSSHYLSDSWHRYCITENMKIIEMVESDKFSDESIKDEINKLKELIQYEKNFMCDIC